MSALEFEKGSTLEESFDEQELTNQSPVIAAKAAESDKGSTAPSNELSGLVDSDAGDSLDERVADEGSTAPSNELSDSDAGDRLDERVPRKDGAAADAPHGAADPVFEGRR